MSGWEAGPTDPVLCPGPGATGGLRSGLGTTSRGANPRARPIRRWFQRPCSCVVSPRDAPSCPWRLVPRACKLPSCLRVSRRWLRLSSGDGTLCLVSASRCSHWTARLGPTVGPGRLLHSSEYVQDRQCGRGSLRWLSVTADRQPDSTGSQSTRPPLGKVGCRRSPAEAHDGPRGRWPLLGLRAQPALGRRST